MSLDITKIQLLGPATISVGGVDVGHTDEKGLTAKIATEFAKAFAGKYGRVTPVEHYIAGQGIEVEFMLVQTVFTNLDDVLPGATVVTSGGNSKLTFGKISGTKQTSVALVIAPILAGNAPTYNLTIPAAVPVGEFNLVYAGDGVQVWACKFMALINEASGADGSYLCTFGDTSITADAVAPTVSSVVPADGATGVATTGSVTWTMSENIDPNTVNAGSVLLFKDDPAGTGLTQIAVTVTMPAANQIAAAYAGVTAGKLYRAILLPTIKDLAGNALAVAYTSDFNT